VNLRTAMRRQMLELLNARLANTALMRILDNVARAPQVLR